MKNSKFTPRYEELLAEVRKKVDVFLRSTAKEYLPKMYQALRSEDANLSPEDARGRIEKDCAGIWSKRTILDALPNEAKDAKKQKAGRLRQKEANSAAVSVAPSPKKNKEIIVGIDGKPIENDTPPLATSLAHTSKVHHSQLLNNNPLHFQFSLSSKNVFLYLLEASLVEKESREDQIWFNGILDKQTGEVIFATIGRIQELQKDRVV